VSMAAIWAAEAGGAETAGAPQDAAAPMDGGSAVVTYVTWILQEG
jgi:hypothetical protein